MTWAQIFFLIYVTCAIAVALLVSRVPKRPPSALGRLEDFVNGHKARHCRIEIDDGYGATCWRIELYTEKGMIHVAEVAFLENADGTPLKLKPNCYVVRQEDDDSEWPGLEKVVDMAVDKAVALCRKKEGEKT
jgi:hypothetical protein